MKSAPISFISPNPINQHPSHAIQMYICAYTSSVYNLEPYSGIQRQRECLWTLVDPDLYMRRVDIFPHYSLYFSFLIFPQRKLSLPISLSHDRLFPSPQHHVCLYPPIFSCWLHILLLFVRTISP